MRKALYRLLGMKIGRHSRVMMKTIVTHPWKISIGDNTTVNEYCYLDGRGGLAIGDRVNVALFSMLITGSHELNSPTFQYFAERIVVEDDVWIGARAVVLNGCTLEQGCVVGAGSVVSPRKTCKSFSVYAGVPAMLCKERDLEDDLAVEPWKVCFR